LRNTPHDIKTAVDWFNALLTYFESRNLSTPRQQKNYVVDVRNAIKSGFGEDHPAGDRPESRQKGLHRCKRPFDCEGRFHGLARDVTAASLMIMPAGSKYVSAAFGSLDLPWKPGHLRSAYGAICCHKFKPKNQTDYIFLAQILGHKLLGPNASLSVGQSYKDFYIRYTGTVPVGSKGYSITYDSGRSL
jgi:hypothetical protein